MSSLGNKAARPLRSQGAVMVDQKDAANFSPDGFC
jgi:hypothetical protein